jgi:TatD DNase family protein
VLVDSHCHLDDQKFASDIEAVIGRAQEAGVQSMMTIGTGDGPPDLEAAIRLADRFDCLYATVGVQPHDASKATPEAFKQIEELARHPKVLAIGEIGLDFHYDFSPRDVQLEVFSAQLDIARRVNKPIIIHTREAWPETYAAFETHWDVNRGGIIHCFTGGPAEAERCVALGFHISFSGIVTYPKAVEIQQAARITPANRLLVETDAPYLAPIPHRGQRNEPAFVVETARKVAELRGEEFDIVAQTTSRNWRKLFLPALP